MSHTSPLFSVVIPAYNAAAFIRQTLQSIYAQTEQDYEIIVVNDGSSDNTESILQQEIDPRLRVITQPNGGECNARNRGVREARGTYVAFLDCDDAWLPNHLALARRFFEQNPSIDWFSTKPERTPNISPSDLMARNIENLPFWGINWFLEGDEQTSSSSAVLRRAAINSQDLFPDGVRMFGDGIGWSRFAMQHRIIGTCYCTTALYRIWGGSATDTFLAQVGGNKSGAALDAYLLQQEMLMLPDCPTEAKLFFQRSSLYNWWIRARATSLLHWRNEIYQRRHTTGKILTSWLILCVYFSHLTSRVMGKLVRLRFNRIERQMKKMAAETRRKLA
jgi:glycosyltransferase involved in cell wall biosynthesis